jgi:RHS repeat-associated protein
LIIFVTEFFNFIEKNTYHWQGKLVEEFNYYPYGLMFDHTQALLTTSNNNLFNGKELQHNEFGYNNGLEVYDFGARLYEPQIGRWSAQDPLADVSHWQSP